MLCLVDNFGFQSTQFSNSTTLPPINESFQRPFPSWGSESAARFQAHSKSELMLPSKCNATAIETQQRRLIILKNSWQYFVLFVDFISFPTRSPLLSRISLSLRWALSRRRRRLVTIDTKIVFSFFRCFHKFLFLIVRIFVVHHNAAWKWICGASGKTFWRCHCRQLLKND